MGNRLMGGGFVFQRWLWVGTGCDEVQQPLTSLSAWCREVVVAVVVVSVRGRNCNHLFNSTGDGAA